MKKRIVVILLLLVVSLLAVSCNLKDFDLAAQKDWSQDTAAQVTVTGVGEVRLVPDVAYVTLGVRSVSEEAGEAVTDNNKMADDIIAALKANGVEQSDISTSSFSVYWTEEWQGEGLPYKKVYVVENMVDVTVRNFDDLGVLLDSALDAGANSVYNVHFDVQDKSEALEQARALAVEDAQMQAEQLTLAAGVTLGDLVSISSWNSPTVVEPMYAWGIGGGGAMMESDSSVPMSGGQLVVQVEASMVYGIEK